MTLTTTLRPPRALPGVTFLPAPEPAGRDLPPLDVAAFIGYAARGPLDLPVVVEDAAAFTAVFGSDLALALEKGGAPAWANLPSAVPLFFANGGRRAVVVRVAGAEPTRSRFHLPGMVALPAEGEPRLAAVHAAWPGRWSATLQLATRQRWTPLDPAAFSRPGGTGLAWLPGGAPETIQPGDLLQITIAGETWLAPITAVAPPVEDAAVNGANGAFTLAAGRAWRLVDFTWHSPPLDFAAVYRLTHEGARPLAIIVDDWTVDAAGQVTLTLSGEVAGLEPGAVLWLDQGSAGYLCPLAELGSLQDAAGSPPAPWVIAQVPQTLALLAGPLPAGLPEKVVRLRFDLLARDKTQRREAGDLAFNRGLSGGQSRGHPHFWGNQIYLGSSPLRPAPGREQPAAAAARFYHALQAGEILPDEEKSPPDPAAFGALLAPLTAADSAHTFLPLGMLSVAGDADYRGPAATGDEGLDQFDVDRFFDAHLMAAGPAVLEAAAFDRRFVQKQRLRGLHSLYFEAEVALVCLPDAVHRAWQEADPPEPAVVPPWQPQPPDNEQFLVCWPPPAVQHVQPAQGSTLGGTPVTITGMRFTTSEQTEVLFDGVPAGQVTVLNETTLTCIAPPHTAPGLVTVTVRNWFGDGHLADAFTYQPPPLAGLPQLEPEAAYEEAPLRRAQRLLLQFCQARRDVVAILTLPAHYRPQDCLDWQENLRRDFRLPPWGYVRADAYEVADISYGAVYHPWLYIADPAAAEGLRAVPAGGVACGQIAQRERQRQVWIAPANQPLADVLGLYQQFSAADQSALFARGFNLAGREVGVFRFISAHTLSDRPAWFQLSVRRLLILLRKILFARGMDYVFESNDERFRAGVQFALEDLLQGMYERGAFTGAAPRQAYRVSTSPDLNPRQSVEQGRFIAEIKVAPAQPLEFITVQLLRAGDGALQVLEG